MRPDRLSVLSAMERQTMRKISWRILPIVVLLYLVAYLDRVSLGYAQLKMGAELGIDPAAFGLAASVFFIGYMLLEVPSNAILYKIGSRLWLTRIGVTWGLITVGTAFVQNEFQLIIARVLLGIAEAGLGPGVVFYLATFFPAAYKARAAGVFFVGAPLAGAIAGPLAGLILTHVTWGGLASWRWVFVLFGVPAVVVGVVLYLVLRDTVDEVGWLQPDQKEWLANTLVTERGAVESRSDDHRGDFWPTLKDPKVAILALVQFLLTSGTFSLGFWAPQIVQGLTASVSPTVIGLVSALPFLVGCFTLLANGWHSDRTNERILHLAGPVLIGAVALAVMPSVSTSPVFGIVVLCVASGGIFAYAAPLWAIAQQQFVGRRAAISLAALNTLGAGGGLVAPYVFGLLTKTTESTNIGMYYLSSCLVAAAVLVIVTRRRWINLSTMSAAELEGESAVPRSRRKV